jgi:hypothetical protein
MDLDDMDLDDTASSSVSPCFAPDIVSDSMNGSSSGVGVQVRDHPYPDKWSPRIVMSAGNALAWVDTPSGWLLAKWSVVPERFPRLAETARLTSWLHGRGLPVSAPVPARDGRLQIEVDRVSMGLQRGIEGDLLDTADLNQVRAAGAILAQLQDALGAYPDADQIPRSPVRPSR